MNWSTIIQTIEKAVQENLETIVLMLIVVGSLNAINIVLGTIIGTVKEEFNFKKFIFGIFKAIVIGLCIFAFCYTLNLFALTLQLTKDVTISSEFITTLEVFTILITFALDISKDVLEKVKSLKELKYVKFEDVQMNPSSQKEMG